ncbi:MAG: hypothetical protein HKN13_07685 [Rhodothermales bacterium]|nr:hypothetical protein [Rhodothermales bacterium]
MHPSQPLSLVWIDDYHGGDPLFVQSLARGLAAQPPDHRRAILVLGGLDRAQRLLEANAIPVEVRDGVPISADPAARALIERACREVNKEAVAVLTEFGVPAVGIQGCDRGLLTIAESRITPPSVAWLEKIVANGAVPVVSALAAGRYVRPVPIGKALAALATGFSGADIRVILFLRDPSIRHKSNKNIYLSDISRVMADHDVKVVRKLLSDGIRVVVTDARSAFGGEQDTYLQIST